MEIHAAYHEQQEECIICLDTVETEWRDLECHHRYHKKCIEDWIVIRATCPLCLKTIKKIEERNTDVVNYIAIRRFMLFILLVVCVIVVMVLCSS